MWVTEVNPFIIQQLLVSQWHWQANTMPVPSGYGLSYWPILVPVYQHWQLDQYHQAPVSDPHSRYQLNHHRFHRTEPLHTYNLTRESSGRIQEDRSTGIRPGHARISPDFNTEVGEVWRTPSKNLSMADCNLT